MNCCNLTGQDKGVQFIEEPDCITSGELVSNINGHALNALRVNNGFVTELKENTSPRAATRTKPNAPKVPDETAKHIHAVVIQLNMFACTIC
jgi:hypothetical protein